MKTKTTLSVSSARGKIFSIIKDVQNSGTYYTLTERGVPVAVVVSSEKFESMVKKEALGFIDFLEGKNLPSFAGSVLFDEASKKYVSKGNQLGENSFNFKKNLAHYAKEEKKIKEADYVRSVLLVELVGKHEYPMEFMEVGRYVQIGSINGKKYMEADILAGDENGDARVVFEVAPFDDYENRLEGVVANLYDLAQAVSWRKKPFFLVYYSRAIRAGKVHEKISTIDFRKFETLETWKKTGRPLKKEIPNYSSLSA